MSHDGLPKVGLLAWFTRATQLQEQSKSLFKMANESDLHLRLAGSHVSSANASANTSAFLLRWFTRVFPCVCICVVRVNQVVVESLFSPHCIQHKRKTWIHLTL